MTAGSTGEKSDSADATAPRTPEPGPSPTPPPVSSRTARSAPPRSTTTAGQSSVSFGTTTSITTLKLRGEIRFPAGRSPIAVEFQLSFRPRGDRALGTGTVQFLSGPDRGEPVPVEGVFRNRTLNLSQVTNLPRGGYNLPIIHLFVIEFPDANEPAEIAGTWSFGARNGRLALKVLLPQPPGH